jgi:hypothetical protein
MTIGMHRTLGVLLTACALTTTPTLADGPPGTIHVVAGATNGDGQSWATAFGDLQSALAAARSNPSTTQIWLAGGTYTPAPVGQRQTPFELVDGVPLFGGFEGDESALADRPPLHEPGSPSTVLSGDLAGDDAGLMNLTDNAQRILLAAGHANAVEIDGVVIRGAYWADVGRKGLGLYINAPGLTLRDVIVEDNRAENVIAWQDEPDLGGGIGVYYTTEPASPGDAEPNAFAVTVERSVFRRNAYEALQAGKHWMMGVGMWCDLPRGTAGDITVTDSVFRDMVGQAAQEGNMFADPAGVAGTAFAVYRSFGNADAPVGPASVAISASTFERNKARSRFSRGGAVAVLVEYPGDRDTGPLSLTVDDSDFIANDAMNRVRQNGNPDVRGAHGGGALLYRGAWDSGVPDLGQRLTIRDSRFVGNRVFAGGTETIFLSGLGAAVLHRGGGESMIERCEFEDNAVTRDSFDGNMVVGYTGGAFAASPIFSNGRLATTVRESRFIANTVDIANDRVALQEQGPNVLAAAIALVGTDAVVDACEFQDNGIVFKSDDDEAPGAIGALAGGAAIGAVPAPTGSSTSVPTLTVRDSTILGSYILREPNSGDYEGGIYATAVLASTPLEIVRTTVDGSRDDDQATSQSLAAAVGSFSDMTLEESRITNTLGRGVALVSGTITRSEIVNNTIDYSEPINLLFFGYDGGPRVGGAGVWVNLSPIREDPVTIADSLIANNTGPIASGVWVDAGAGEVTITNTTIADNAATGPYPAGLAFWGDPNAFVTPDRTIANTILWGNTAAGLTGPEVQLAEQFGLPPADQTPQIDRIASTTIQDWLGPFDDGVSNADPLFVDAPAGDYRLQPGSPALDSGNNTLAAPGSVLDLDGSARFVDDPTAPDTGVGPGPIVDRGAYERGGTGCAADLAAPFGDLTFADIARFLQAFANGEPGVDGAEPFGQLTFADIAWYLTAFAAGCGS